MRILKSHLINSTHALIATKLKKLIMWGGRAFYNLGVEQIPEGQIKSIKDLSRKYEYFLPTKIQHNK